MQLENSDRNKTKLANYIKSERDIAKKDIIKILKPDNKIILDFGCQVGNILKFF